MILRLLMKECPDKYVWNYPKFGIGLISSLILVTLLILIPYSFGNFGFLRTCFFTIYTAFISGTIYYCWLYFIKYKMNRKYLLIEDFAWANVILILISIFIYLYGKINNSGLVFFLDKKTAFFTLKNSFVYTFIVGLSIYFLLFFIEYYFENYIIEMVTSINTSEKPSVEINGSTHQLLIANSLISSSNTTLKSVSSTFSDTLASEPVVKVIEEKLVILGKNNNEELEMLAENFIYAQASGNYLDVVYYDKKKNVKRETIRNSVSELLNQIDRFEYIIQIHRSYVVNLNYVISVNGTVKNSILKLQKRAKILEFPVARAKVSSVKFAFKSFEM